MLNGFQGSHSEAQRLAARPPSDPPVRPAPRPWYGQGWVKCWKPSEKSMIMIFHLHCPYVRMKALQQFQIPWVDHADRNKYAYGLSRAELRLGGRGRHRWAASRPVSRSAEWPGQLQQPQPRVDGPEDLGETDGVPARGCSPQAWYACPACARTTPSGTHARHHVPCMLFSLQLTSARFSPD